MQRLGFKAEQPELLQVALVSHGIVDVGEGGQVPEIADWPLSRSNGTKNIGTERATGVLDEGSNWTSLLQRKRPQIKIPPVAADAIAWVRKALLVDGLHCWCCATAEAKCFLPHGRGESIDDGSPSAAT